MPSIHVVKAFYLQLDPKQIGVMKDEKTGDAVAVMAQQGDTLYFALGQHEVPQEIAEHWYVRPHLAGYVEPAPHPGMADYAQRVIAAERAGRNTTSVEEAQPQPPRLPDGVMTPEHYFAGKKLPEETRVTEAPNWMMRGG